MGQVADEKKQLVSVSPCISTMLRTLSASDIELLQHLPIYRSVEIPRAVPHRILHSLLDLGLQAWRISKWDDFGLSEVKYDEVDGIYFAFSEEPSQSFARLILELDEELRDAGLPPSNIELVPY